ncbi:polysaccharide pyruvyl transferase family protein [Desulfosporosinus sp. BG]|uniref:polysaccharide pyruvyl transferase family protein n=1 Tax=Desulfosporosinus sp. BG TaxID=1633135 RepID=UPI00083A69DE|nr:polysaccharide pyruvyl transferase family protein [Desulfosporosinus sp. BG]ODA40289.1 AMSJ/WSAK related protein [Desulfosporosinus sp. BG]
MKSIKQVMLYAYLNSNLGDDLFIKIIVERYPDICFKLIAPTTMYKKTYKHNGNLKIYNLGVFIKKLDSMLLRITNKNIITNFLAKTCIASVYIGGSLFIQSNFNWRKIYKLNKIKMIQNQPFYLLGANFGPYQDVEFYNSYKELFRKYEDICFRESYSYNLFKDLKNTRFAPDIVFTYNPSKNIAPKKQIAISVINLKNRLSFSKYHLTYIKQLINICEDYISKGYEIQLVSFCSNQGDIEAVKEIQSGIKKEYQCNVHQYLYEGDIESCVSVLKESVYILATRFHAMILGWIVGRPVFPIIYSDKMLNVIEDTGFKGKFIRIQEIDSLSMDDVYYNLQNQIVLDIEEQKLRAEEQFLHLDKQLKYCEE